MGLEGALWVLESRTTPGAREFIYKDGQLTPHLVADPVYGLAQGGFLHRPVRIGDQVYAYAVGVPGQSYPATLRLMTFDDFNSLAAEAVP